MMRKYVGNKKSIEARSDDGGKVWQGKLFDSGRMTEFSQASLAELDRLARKHGMELVPKGR